MTKKKHQKHTKLNRLNYGFFARNEWAIIGAPCRNIQQLAFQITAAFAKKYKVSYIDADHKSTEEKTINRPTSLAFGANLEYIDKIDFHRFDTKADLDTYQYRQYFNEQDLVLVNGNHFKAKKQIVVIDPTKEESLKRKLDRLTDVSLILMKGTSQFPTFLSDHLTNFTIPIFKFEETNKIIALLQKELEKNIPPLYGLVLAGGKSQRMGRDKGLIDYHGKPQRLYLAELLDQISERTFLSFRPGQLNVKGEKHSTITDTFFDLGPFGAIASAFRTYPNVAWLVVACDLPFLDLKILNYLVTNRNPSAIATAFNNPINEFPEPLISIWEPKSYAILLQFLAQGYACPRKVLINTDVHLLDAPNENKLQNINDPREMKAAVDLISSEKIPSLTKKTTS